MTKQPVSNKRIGNGKSDKPAVVYCRVASAEQSGPCGELDAQEARCRAYAEQRGLTVLQVYKEIASGAAPDRPILTEMVGFLKSQGEIGIIVIVDDILRLARGLAQHHEIRAAIADAGGVVEAPSLAAVGDAPSSLLESVLVSLAAHRAPEEKALS